MPTKKQQEDTQPLTELAEGVQFTGIHAEFLADKHEQIDLEGARFSGKTWACCAYVVNYCIQYPGMEWLICRYSKDDALKMMKPEFQRVANRMGHFPTWDGDGFFAFANGSKVLVGGLRSQDKVTRLSKVRGRGVAGLWNDQSEETPEDIGQELLFATRQPGYPHRLIFSPNPPPEDHWLSDTFPDDNSVEGRKYYRLTLYDNPHCPESKLAELERAYPPTHAAHKRLILGLRGPAVTGQPIYGDAFERDLHVQRLTYNADLPLLESFDLGRHNPMWMVAQRTYFGGFEILGGIMGKRMFIQDFLPIIDRYRLEWFPNARQVLTCCDPPPGTHDLRSTNIEILRKAGLRPRWSDHANSPDVREAVIQNIASLMRRRLGKKQALLINEEPKHWLMASSAIIKQTKVFVDGCEATYAWDQNFISVGSKKVRQPIVDEWVDGPQRCLENLVLNFGSIHSQDDRDRRTASLRESTGSRQVSTPSSWLGF